MLSTGSAGGLITTLRLISTAHTGLLLRLLGRHLLLRLRIGMTDLSDLLLLCLMLRNNVLWREYVNWMPLVIVDHLQENKLNKTQ